MDIIIHWGVYRHQRHEIGAAGWVMLTAIALDLTVLTAFAALKWQSDPLIVFVSVGLMATVFLFVWAFLRNRPVEQRTANTHTH